MKARKDFFFVNLSFSFCLNPPFVLEWYLAFFLDKFSKMNTAKMNKRRKKDILFEKAKSSKVIQEL